jgi:opacity protein-like surface antigen
MKPDRAIELTSTVMKLKRLLVVSFCLLLSVSVAAQETPPQGQEEPEETQEPQTYKEQYEKYQKQAKKTIEYPWFVGGAVGLAFGSETSYAEFSPIFGYRFSPLFQLGGSLTFRYRKDKRYEPDLSTTDYGASVVGRFFVFDPIFLQAEIERLNWEYVAVTEEGFEAVEDTYTGYYAGFGFVQRASDRVAMYMAFLWDFSYDENEPSPNTRPYLIRIGFGFAF